MPLVLDFLWPSVVYILDILAWDAFFARTVLCAAAAYGGNRLVVSIRVLLILSGVLALSGLSRVITGDMQRRSTGILGYAVVFPLATGLLVLLFHRTTPVRRRRQTAHGHQRL